jgi:hypothetical protein
MILINPFQEACMRVESELISDRTASVNGISLPTAAKTDAL